MLNLTQPPMPAIIAENQVTYPKIAQNPNKENNRLPRQHNNHNQRSDMKCFNCGGYGHMARDCGKGKITDYSGLERQ